VAPLLLVRLVQATLVQGRLLVHLVEATLVPLVEATQAVHQARHLVQVVATLVLVPLGRLVEATLVPLVPLEGATLEVARPLATLVLVLLEGEGILGVPLVVPQEATLVVPLAATLEAPHQASRATLGPPRWTLRWPSGSRRWTRTTPAR